MPDETKFASIFPNRFAAPGMPGGAAAVVCDGQIVWSHCVGLADVETGTPIDTRTNFRLASVSKQVTAVAALVLVDRGELALTTPVSEIAADLPPWAEGITVEHLLSHTSGLPEYYDLDAAGLGDAAGGDGQEDTPLSSDKAFQLRDADVLALLRRASSLDFEPGSRYHYNNAGYALLTLAVEQRSGQSFSAFLHDHVFSPLGMTNTVALVSGEHEASPRALGHLVSTPNEPERHEPSDPSLELSRTTQHVTRTDRSRYSAVLGDGGVYSSLEDLARWHHGLKQGKVISLERLAQAQSPYRLRDQTPIEYGFGWRVSPRLGRPCVWHNGSSIGFRTALHHYPHAPSAPTPANDLTVVVLMNRHGDDQPESADIADAMATRWFESDGHASD